MSGGNGGWLLAPALCPCFLPSSWIPFLNPAFLALTLSSLVYYCHSDWHSVSLFCSTWCCLLPWSPPKISTHTRYMWVNLTSLVVWPDGVRGCTTAMQITQNQMPVTRILFLNVPLATVIPLGYFLFISSYFCFPFFVPSFPKGKSQKTLHLTLQSCPTHPQVLFPHPKFKSRPSFVCERLMYSMLLLVAGNKNGFWVN